MGSYLLLHIDTFDLSLTVFTAELFIVLAVGRWSRTRFHFRSSSRPVYNFDNIPKNKKPTNWRGNGKTKRHKIRPKAIGSGTFGRFPNFDKCRSEVAGDVIPGGTVDYFGIDVRATFGASGLNICRIILLFGRLDPFYASHALCIGLHFAADRKQPATSYSADL